jgi:gliding motility-associated-like protein
MRVFVAFLFIFISTISYSQKEANVWYFGENAGLNFNSGSPVALTDGQLITDEGSASISNASGDLLFYTDGSVVFNKNHVGMSNGSGLLGNSSSAQSGIIVPKPKDSNIYYIFTVDRQGGGSSVHFSEIDMTLDGGLGAVTIKNTPLNQSSGAKEKITSVKGADCDTFWVITGDSNQFQAYLVNDTGVITSAISSANIQTGGDLRGSLKLSPNGTKLVSAGNAGSYIYDFNDATGSISNGRALNVNDGYGAEFSRSSNKLYISTGAHSQVVNGIRNAPESAEIFQFSLESSTIADINASRQEIYNTSTGYRGALQLGPDGKIYYAQSRTDKLGVINFPEKNFNEVGFNTDGVDLNGEISTEGLPPFISSLLIPIEIKDNSNNSIVINNLNLELCIGQNKVIAPDPVTGINVTYKWTFDDGTTTTTLATTRLLTLNNIQTSSTGKYLLTVEQTDACGNTLIAEGDFTITVYEAAAATKPTDINFCDINNTGFSTFDLQATKTTDILNGQNSGVFEVLYFTSQANADDNTNAILNPYPNPTAYSNQTIYARVHNIVAPNACFETTSFKLAVTGLPVPQDPTDYNICDNTSVGTDTDGFIDGFTLSSKDAEILGSLDPLIYSVTYHTTLPGAQTDNTTDVIDKANPYSNVDINTQPIFVRVENNNNTECFDATKTFNLVVNPLPIITDVVELKQCDDDVDGFSIFNLNESASDTSTNFTNETFVFYPTLNDAENDTNIIPNPTTFINRTVTSDIVWARAISAFGCFRISEVTLTVSTTGIPPSFQRSFTLCDDFLDIGGNDTTNNDDTDGVTSFDFSTVTAEVRVLFPISQQLTITYYRNQADALAEIDPITDPSNYRNTGYPTTQQIYIRVDSNLDNDCLGFGPYITLNVDTVPMSTTPSNLELCDNFDDGNGTNGIVQTFNLTSQNTTILGGQDPTDFTVTYHSSSENANTGSNPLASPYTNTTKDTQTIYARVENKATGCFNDHVSFDLIVNPLPIANFVNDIEICDDNSDGSARNGFSQIFDLESQTAGVLGTQDPTNYSVTYHNSLTNAQNNILPLGSPYSNNIAFRQRIYVRVFNTDTQCANGISNFDVIVNQEPIAETVSNLSYCDNDFDAEDDNGFIQNIDLDSQILNILGTTQIKADFDVTFHLSNTEATSGANALSSPFSNTIANQQTIYVHVLDKKTGCINDAISFDVIVNPLPVFEVTTPQIVCLNGPDLTIGVEGTGAVYTYEWQAPDGTITTNDELTISSGGLYTITATATDGTGCSRTRAIQVNESIIATITEEDITIVDDSDNNSIAIDNSIGNLGIGDYEFSLADTDGNILRYYQDEPLFEGLKGGVYSILVRDKNGCGVASVIAAVITYPKFFTPNNDGVLDTWIIPGSNNSFFTSVRVEVFDRYGKIVALITDQNGPSWNGTYNGKKLPSNDYWFNAILEDINGNIRKKIGNFSLLRK